MRHRHYRAQGLSRRDVALTDRLNRWPTRSNKRHMLSRLQSEHGRTGYIYRDHDIEDEEPETRWCRLDPEWCHPRKIKP